MMVMLRYCKFFSHCSSLLLPGEIAGNNGGLMETMVGSVEILNTLFGQYKKYRYLSGI